MPARQNYSESRSLKRCSMSCDEFDVFAALNTLAECSSPFWQIDPIYLVHKKKTCCLSLCRWLIGSSLRDPFRDCGMNFSARRRHAGPNVNPYHCAYTVSPPPSLTFHPPLSTLATQHHILLWHTEQQPVQSAVVIVDEQSPWTTKCDPLQNCSGKRGGLWRRQRDAGPEAVGVTFVVGRLSPPSRRGGGASEYWQRRGSDATHTHARTLAHSHIYVLSLTEPLE